MATPRRTRNPKRSRSRSPDHVGTSEIPFDAFDITEGAETQRSQLRDVILPQISKRAAAAATLARVRLAYFARRPQGGNRRCSCFTEETMPRSTCVVCFGTGVTGGYDKLGFQVETVDVTSLNTRMVNVVPRFDLLDAPVRFALRETAVAGYIETEIPLLRSQGILDAFQSNYTIAADAWVTVSVRDAIDSDWVPLGMAKTGPQAAFYYKKVIETRLARANGQGSLKIKISMSRANPTSTLPIFESIYLRYQISPSGPARVGVDSRHQAGTYVHGDTSRTPKALSASDIGIFKAYETTKFFLDGTLKNLSTQDFFEDLDTGERWKLVNVNEGRSQGLTFEWSTTARIVQHYKEPYGRVPK